MNFAEYQESARRTQNKSLSLYEMRLHALHGLSGEVGEIHSVFQKTYQGHTLDETALRLEIGDVLWFIAEFCDCYGWDLEDIAVANIDKLRNRYPERFTPEQSINRIEYRDKQPGAGARHYAQGEGHRG